MRPILVCLAAVVLAVPAFAATNLAKYAGSYPSDEVGGMTFLGDPAVIAGVTKAVPDKAVRDWVLDPNSVQTPISRAGGLLRSGAGLLPWVDIRRYAEVDPGNARLRQLDQRRFPTLAQRSAHLKSDSAQS